MSRTLVLTIWPEQEIVVTDAEASDLEAQGLVLTNDGAEPRALLYGTPVMNGGTP